MPKAKARTGADDVPSSNQTLSWSLVLSYQGGTDHEETVFSMEQAFAAELGRRLQVLVQESKVTSLGSHKVFEGLEVSELNIFLGTLDVDGLHAHRSLVSLNNMLHMAPNAIASALAEHGTVEALMRLHQRVSMAHELSPTVMLVLHAICINYEELYGHLDLLASKQAVVELVVSSVIWLGNAPERLHSQIGLSTANRAVQICWSLSRHGTSASSAVLSLFSSVDLAGRALHLAASLGSGEAADQEHASPSSSVMDDGRGRTVGELSVGLSAVCASFAAATLGLGGVLDASPAGLHKLRSWMLKGGHLSDMHTVTLALVDELHESGPLLVHLRAARKEEQEQEQASAPAGSDKNTPQPEGVASTTEASDKQQPEATAAAAAADAHASGPSPDLAAAASSSGSAVAQTAAGVLLSLQASIEGALRNLLTCVGVPLLCADPGVQGEVTALTSFALQYYYILFQEGFSDIFKLLSNRSTLYRGPYLPFFCAFSELMQEGILAIGPQFAAWGVQLEKPQDGNEDGAMGMFVPSGPDSASAHAFITEQVTSCVGWSMRMRKVIQLSQRAALSRQTMQQSQAGAAPAAGEGSEALMSTPPKGACAFCSNEVVGSAKLKMCPCGLAGYCGKTCQVAHFPKHKMECKARRQQNK